MTASAFRSLGRTMVIAPIAVFVLVKFNSDLLFG